MDREMEITQSALERVVSRFYARVREDACLAPVFNDAVADWPDHLEKLANFWSSVMLGSGLYKGNPVVAHLKQKARITPELFERWLTLWNQTTTDVMAPAAAAALQAKAARIAESMQLALFFKIAPPPKSGRAAA